MQLDASQSKSENVSGSGNPDRRTGDGAPVINKSGINQPSLKKSKKLINKKPSNENTTESDLVFNEDLNSENDI